MPSARTAAEFVASLRGELYVAATSPETLLGGGSAKGATWLLRALKTALREAGTAAVTDSIKQWQNIEAGIQERFDGTRTVISADLSGVFGAASNAGIDAVRLGIKRTTDPLGGKVAVEASNIGGRKLLTAKEKAADLKRRVAEVEKMAVDNPVSAKYVRAEVGHADHFDYAKTFHQKHEGLEGKVEVHHAVEQNVLEWYKDLFQPHEIHSLENLRGIPRTEHGSALHRSVIRKAWDDFRDKNPAPTREQVKDFATSIDRKYGGLFKPPL